MSVAKIAIYSGTLQRKGVEIPPQAFVSVFYLLVNYLIVIGWIRASSRSKSEPLP